MVFLGIECLVFLSLFLSSFLYFPYFAFLLSFRVACRTQFLVVKVMERRAEEGEGKKNWHCLICYLAKIMLISRQDRFFCCVLNSVIVFQIKLLSSCSSSFFYIRISKRFISVYVCVCVQYIF